MTDSKPRQSVSERVTALELENERRLDEIRRLVEIVRSQSETLNALMDMIGDQR